MAGLYSLIKVWGDTEVVAASDLNAELANVKNNMVSTVVEGYSSFNNVYNQNRAQATVDPAPSNDPSQSVDNQTLAGEVQKLRYVIKRILGSSASQYYSVPSTDLSFLGNFVSGFAGTALNCIVSGKMSTTGQPMYLTPSGSTTSVTLSCASTNLACVINGTNYTFTSDITLTGLSTQSATNSTAVIVNDSMVHAVSANKTMGESFVHMVDPGSVAYQEHLNLGTIGTNISGITNKMVAFKLNGEYSVGYPQNSGAEMWNCYRGFFFDSTGTWLPRVNCANSDTLTLMKLGYVFLRSGGTLNVTYNQPSVSGVAPSSPSAGDYWYDTVNQQWKMYNGSFANDSAVYVGMVVIDATKAVAARSSDFFGSYSTFNTIEIQRDFDLNNIVRCTKPRARCSVYGTGVYFDGSEAKWDTTLNLDSGVSLAANAYLFLYLNKYGTPFISDVVPHSRADLGGYYHPANPWRCLGYVRCNHGGTALSMISKSFETYPLNHTRSILYGADQVGSTSTAGPAYFGPNFKFVSRGKPLLLSLEGDGGTTLTSGLSITSSSGAGFVTLLLGVGITTGGTGQDSATLLFYNLANIQYLGNSSSNTRDQNVGMISLYDLQSKNGTAGSTPTSIVAGELTLRLNVTLGGAINSTNIGYLRITELP